MTSIKKWVLLWILNNQRAIKIVVDFVVAVSDRKFTDEEKESLKKQLKEWIQEWW